jgi:cardiolipin synthase
MAGLVVWSLAGLALCALLTWLVHRWRDEPGTRLRLCVADQLTVLRLVLTAPTAWLLLQHRYPAAAAVYVVLIATDVADGIVARRRRETSAFGVFMDPLADILSTFAVFTVFVIDGLVPWWLYALLLFRYLMLGAGSLALARVAGPVEFHATLPGKIVGAAQAAGALWIMRAAWRGREETIRDGPLFAFLGLAFASIVVSQAVIGYRHVRRARARGWQRGSSR